MQAPGAQPWQGHDSRDHGFNPHPARRPGASSPELALQDGMSQGQRSFNPHPARRPGARAPPSTGCDSQGQIRVSILTRPEGRVQVPIGAFIGVKQPCVSILTRPEGRVQGRGLVRNGLRLRGFNPHPARRPGASIGLPVVRVSGIAVSILTRPEGRVQADQVARARRPE